MSQNKTHSKWIYGLGALFCAVGVVGVFQNCGEQRAFFPNRQAYTPIEKIQDDFAVTYKGVLSEGTCSDSSQYTCEHEIFSAYGQNETLEADFDCIVVEGTELCPKGVIRTYDSSNAVSAQEYESFYCSLDIPDMDGVYPVQGSGDDLVTALTGAYQTCLELAAR